MKFRKHIGFAYPGSNNAVALGFGRTGCYYIGLSIKREDGTWSPSYLPHNAEGFLDRNDPDLLALFEETEGTIDRAAMAF
jgi:hypothetical protein